MNERIRELLEQAGFDVKRLLEPYPGGFPREDFLALESFAELLVRECIREIGYKSVELLDIDFYTHYQERLKKHFGVAE